MDPTVAKRVEAPPARSPEGVSGNGVGGDPLVPLRHRPQSALARSIIAVRESYRVAIPAYGPIDPADCRDLPLAILATFVCRWIA
jgi:hypothetical protein